jgi:hypothetical protein
LPTVSGARRLDSDIVSLLGKRVYDMAGVLGKSVKVQLNGESVGHTPARSQATERGC